MKNIWFKLIALCIMLLTWAACTKDFDEINKNPNAPANVTPALLLPQVERDIMGTLLGEAWSIGNIVIQHTSKNQFVNEDRYIWGDRTGIWNGVYDNLRDVNNIIKQSEALNDKSYKGIGLVLRAWMFSLATDAYGDIPYSEALKGSEGFNYTNYDTQEAIYNGILNDLKLANDLLAPGVKTASTEDLIYSGDPKKWQKLANSLRVRYLLRISNKRNVGADLRAIIDNPSTNPIFENVADNAVYTFRSTSPDQFPLYTSRIGSFNEFRAAKTLLDTLQRLNDPRMKIFFRGTPDTETSANPLFVGLPNGLNDVEALQYNGGPQFQSRIGALYYENAISTQGLAIAKGVIMTYAELQFLLAEAAERGLISGTAETFYKNGVNGSFGFYNLTTPTGYLDLPQVLYSGTSREKLDKIGFQKWISLYFQGMEAWYDWRRTRIPDLKPGKSNQNNNLIPVRFRYPIIEQALNPEGYKAAVQRQGPDDLDSKMWYLK